MIERIKQEALTREENLSKFAYLSKNAQRLKEEANGLRSAFARDADRIIHCLSYSRYLDKTQVFSFNENDHISKRMIHVQFVSRIARTIGRFLNLNEELIEAASLAHDLGHSPIGHVGESILNEISLREMNEHFFHNVQSVRVLMELNNNGEGSNITYEVLDAVLAHNGESFKQKLFPAPKTKEEFLKEYQAAFKDAKLAENIVPLTLEACVVRTADVIAYLGRDLEDAIIMNYLQREDLPFEIAKVLGNTNSQIINTLIVDLVKTSYGKNYIAFSDEVFKATEKLKEFNYQNIYYKANTKKDLERYNEIFNFLFDRYLYYLDNEIKDSTIYEVFLNQMSNRYLKTAKKRIVIDFISGMTDDYFLEQYQLEKRREI